MAEKAAEYVISADPGPFVSGIKTAATAAKEGASQIGGALNDMGGMFKGVMGHIAAFAGILAGGKFFKDSIAEAAKLTGETMSLSKMLSISAQDASTLNVALKSVGSGADVYTDSLTKLLQHVRANEAEVKAMGMATRSANGELLSGKDLMSSAIETLKQYKEGTDRNLAAQALFGKGAAEASALLKLNSAVMDEAAKKAAALGLVIGPEQAAKTKEYKAAMNDVRLVLAGLENSVGQTVMPVFTELAQWFNSAGPAAVAVMKEAMSAFSVAVGSTKEVVKEFGRTVFEVFSSAAQVATTAAGDEIPSAMRMWQIAMETIKVVFIEVKVTFITIVEEIGVVLKVLVSDVVRVGEVIGAALTGSWDNIKDAWQRGAERGEKIVSESAARVTKMMTDTRAEIDKIMSGKADAVKAAPVPEPAGRSYVGYEPAKADDQKFKAQFAVIKASLEGQLEIQREYLKEAQETYDDAYRHNLLTDREFYAAKLAIEQQNLRNALAIKEQELQQTQTLAEKAKATGKQSDVLALKAQELKITAELTVLNAQMANSELRNTRELNDVLLQKKNAMLEIQRVSAQQASAAGIEQERILIQQKRALGQINDQQEIEAEKQLQERLFQIDLQALREKEAQFDGNLQKIAENHAQIEQLERSHQLRMMQLNSQTVIANQRNMTSMYASMESGLAGVIKQTLQGGLSLRGIFEGLMRSVAGAVIDMLAKTAAEWAMNIALRRTLGSALAMGEVGASAAAAGAAAFASTAAIPVTGPEMAPAAAAAAYAGAMSYAPLASFAVGAWELPGDMIAQVHKGETILPRTFAEDFRANGGALGGGAGVVVNYHDNSGRLSESELRRNAAVIQRILNDQRRKS